MTELTKTRVIVQSSENGEDEYVEFSLDFDTTIEDFIIPGCSIDSENIADLELPISFPFDEILKKDR